MFDTASRSMVTAYVLSYLTTLKKEKESQRVKNRGESEVVLGR